MRTALTTFLLLATSALPAWSQVKIEAIVESASLQPGLPAGGALATVFLSGYRNIFYTKPGIFIAPSPPPLELAGFFVSVNTARAPILAVAISRAGDSMNVQVNFQVPLERNTSLGASYPGLLEVGNGESGESLTPLPGQPKFGGFFSDVNGYAIAQHASDSSRVTQENPAHPGETITVYGTDFFGVWPHPPVGFPAPAEPLFRILLSNTFIRGPGYLYLQEYPRPILNGRCFAGTPALETPFQGLAPGMIGVEQINFVVPANQEPGDWALFYNIGSRPDGSGPASIVGTCSPYVKLPVR